MLDGPWPFWEESSLGPKGGPSIAPLDLDPCSLKNLISTLHEPTSGPCLDLENDRYKKYFPTTPVFGRTFLLEEFVCLGGPGLPETVEFPQPLAILPAETDLSARFLEDSETRFSSEDSMIKAFDNSKKLLDFSKEAIQESGMHLALVS